jgi:hypothetical protein
MPTSAWNVMRGEIVRPFGLEEFVTTTVIAGDDQVISTELGNRWPQADKFNGWYVIIRGTANAAVVRRVQDYSGETGALTLRGATLSASETVNVTCEISTFHPDDVKRAFNRARQNAFPMLGIVRDLDTLVTGPDQTVYTIPSTVRRIQRLYVGTRRAANSLALNLLKDPGFEDWSSATALAEWSKGAGSSSSFSREEQTSGPTNYAVLEGQFSARVLVRDAVSIEQVLNPVAAVALENMELNFSCWVYDTQSKDTVNLRVSGGGVASTPVLSSNHGHTGWERLTVSALTVSEASTSNITLAVLFGRSVDHDCYVDEAICILGPTEPLDTLWRPLHAYRWVPPVAGASDGGKLYLDEPLGEKQRLRIVGVDMLSAVSAETDTVEIDGNFLEPLYDLTRSYLCEERAKQSRGNEAIIWVRRQSEYSNKYEEQVSGTNRLSLPKRPLRDPTTVW